MSTERAWAVWGRFGNHWRIYSWSTNHTRREAIEAYESGCGVYGYDGEWFAKQRRLGEVKCVRVTITPEQPL